MKTSKFFNESLVPDEKEIRKLYQSYQERCHERLKDYVDEQHRLETASREPIELTLINEDRERGITIRGLSLPWQPDGPRKSLLYVSIVKAILDSAKPKPEFANVTPVQCSSWRMSVGEHNIEALERSMLARRSKSYLPLTDPFTLEADFTKTERRYATCMATAFNVSQIYRDEAHMVVVPKAP